MNQNAGLYNAPIPILRSRIISDVEISNSESSVFDFIVIGVGSMGSATCYFLAKQGYSVLGIEQFDITHENGSHAGQTRIIRQAYFEHPDYVPLLKRAYENWKALEDEAGASLYHKTGLLYFGDPGSGLVADTRSSADQYGLELNELTDDEIANKYPQFNLPDNFVGLYEPNAGFVTPERAILTYTSRALALEAEIHSNENVVAWKNDGNSVSVVTDKAKYTCKKLIITAGVWSGNLVPELSSYLSVTRQMIAWVKTKSDDLFKPDKFPCWTLADEEMPGIFYGFPILPEDRFEAPFGLKLGYHYPGIDSDPDNLDREVSQDDKQILVDMMQKYMPQAYESFVDIKACMYTNTPDTKFIVDKLPDNDNVIIASGFSGHGFKFASVIGEILSELAIDGKTSQPIEFLNASRFLAGS